MNNYYPHSFTCWSIIFTDHVAWGSLFPGTAQLPPWVSFQARSPLGFAHPLLSSLLYLATLLQSHCLLFSPQHQAFLDVDQPSYRKLPTANSQIHIYIANCLGCKVKMGMGMEILFFLAPDFTLEGHHNVDHTLQHLYIGAADPPTSSDCQFCDRIARLGTPNQSILQTSHTSGTWSLCITAAARFAETDIPHLYTRQGRSKNSAQIRL